jgi:hypothetical protein
MPPFCPFIFASLFLALLTFQCSRTRFHIPLCIVSGGRITGGGLWHWRKIMGGAMRLQSLAATNQARLLLGPPSVIRIDAPTFEPKLRMDDWKRSVQELLPAARRAVDEHGDHMARLLLTERATKFIPEPALVRE